MLQIKVDKPQKDLKLAAKALTDGIADVTLFETPERGDCYRIIVLPHLIPAFNAYDSGFLKTADFEGYPAFWTAAANPFEEMLQKIGNITYVEVT